MTSVLGRLADALSERYRIERELGQGGMATVYLARDLKHDRDVALKVLHPELGAVIGADRFLQEIKTTARLQHPHILGLIDSGEANGLLFYVMPYVSGESLRGRITREKQLPIPAAIRIATEVASALDYAHRQGVVHRDIKPENVLLHDGQAMVADFGIALAVTAAGGGRITQTGMSLGTPHYMSPEQAVGERDITPRSDIYALGAMTYEMLTGDPPFTGSTAQAILAKVMTEKPVPPSVTRERVPAHIEAAVLTALAKLPADRWDSAKEFADALANPSLTATTTLATPSTASQAELRRWKLAASGLAVLLLLLGAGWAWTARKSRPAPDAATARFTMFLDHGVESTDGPGPTIGFSPDGTRLAFMGHDSAGRSAIFLRSLDATSAVEVPGTHDAYHPTFSPDGSSLAFWVNDRIKSVALAGGTVTTVCEVGDYTEGLAWGPDGQIVMAVRGQLLEVPASGGKPEVIARPDSSGRLEEFRWPSLSPDGGTVFFTVLDSTGDAGLAVLQRSNARVVRLGLPGMSPFYTASGELSWTTREGVLMAAPFDLAGLRVTGVPRALQEGVRTGPARVAKLGMSPTGSYAYIGGQQVSRELVVLDAGGRVTRLPTPKNTFYYPRVSPDGRRIAVNVVTARLRGDIWVYDRTDERLVRLTADSLSMNADWSADGRSLLYHHLTLPLEQMLRVAVDGSGRVDTVARRPGWSLEEFQLAPDGHTAIVVSKAQDKGGDIWIGTVTALDSAKPLVATRAAEGSIALSRSGELLAYVSNETGRDEVYVRKLEPGGAKWMVSREGGSLPRWAANGRDLYFRRGDTIFVASVQPGAEPRPGSPRAVGGLPTYGDFPEFDVLPDGRVLGVRYDLSERQPGLNVVLNGVRLKR